MRYLGEIRHMRFMVSKCFVLFCPWDFPGKSTGVGCHCLLCFFIETVCLLLRTRDVSVISCFFCFLMEHLPKYVPESKTVSHSVMCSSLRPHEQ